MAKGNRKRGARKLRARREAVPAMPESEFFTSPFGMGNRLWGSILGGNLPSARLPDIDVQDTGSGIVVRADMPGVDKKDIRISVSGDRIIISAEGNTCEERRGKNYYYKERSSTGYYRSVALPADVISGSARAKYQNGTLEVELKKRGARPGNEVKVE